MHGFKVPDSPTRHQIRNVIPHPHTAILPHRLAPHFDAAQGKNTVSTKVLTNMLFPVSSETICCTIATSRSSGPLFPRASATANNNLACFGSVSPCLRRASIALYSGDFRTSALLWY